MGNCKRRRRIRSGVGVPRRKRMMWTASSHVHSRREAASFSCHTGRMHIINIPMVVNIESPRSMGDIGQAKSEQLKANRATQENGKHTTGSRSFADVLDQKGEIKKAPEADPSLIGEEAHDTDLYSTVFPQAKKGRYGLGLLAGGGASQRLAEALAKLEETTQENKELKLMVDKLATNQTSMMAQSYRMEQQYNELKTLFLSYKGIAISNVEVQVLKMNPGWKVSIRRCFGYSERSNRHPLIYNEQDVLNNLGDANAMSIINGGTWTSVLYRVQLPNQSRAVVVKKLQNEGGNAEYAGLTNQCQSEVNLLGSIHHNNIISLEDCFRESNFIVLVYNHKENGSLYQWLHNPADPPSWVHRGGFWTGRRGGASPLVPLKGSTTCTMDATTPSCTTTSTLPAYCLTLTSRPRSHASISHRSALPDMTSRCQSTSPLLSTCLATQLQNMRLW
ncbi:uncharacterized protein LOC100827893 isoform X2 [Brachypodium distachyon]|uniref:uncharacterized protein LOC100827893 isoform X2 n=1 Tax=Brachypodium distachyon TaxID=15368 RepID=UPI000D0E29CC|nr:uncharacterized protein LOC100827893 isoform X2 [Brachypodium distachyon]|eukprot:XP_024316599.1 uncharacterized protein LOC100827893 isoform X2 [Brachypodium distachyon]